MIDPVYVKKNFPVIRPEWLAQHVEAVLDPGLPIVDPHHHLWVLPEMTYLRTELLADLRTGHDIRATVYVDCKSSYRPDGPEAMRPVGETEFVVRETDGARQGSLVPCAAIVSWVDLMLGDRVEPVLESHVAAGEGRFRGVRTRATWHAHPEVHPRGEGQPGLLLEPALQQAARRLGASGLSLDVWVFHTQLAEVARLAAACPATTIVLDHCGGPLGIGPFEGRRDEVFGAWRADIEALARHDNVVLKLGGLAMPRMGFDFHVMARPVNSELLAKAWAPYVDVCIQAFGPARCMFESNFPVDKGGCSYPVLWNAFKRLAAGFNATERRALFSRTAADVYRIAVSV